MYTWWRISASHEWWRKYENRLIIVIIALIIHGKGKGNGNCKGNGNDVNIIMLPNLFFWYQNYFSKQFLLPKWLNF